MPADRSSFRRLAINLKALVRRPASTRERESPTRLLAEIHTSVEDHFATALRPFRRGTIMGQAPDGVSVLVAGVGEAVADGIPYPVLTAYTTTIVGAANGPSIGDDIYLIATGPRNEAVALQVNH